MDDIGIKQHMRPPFHVVAWMPHPLTEDFDNKMYFYLPDRDETEQIITQNIYSGKIQSRDIIQFATDEIVHESGHVVLCKIGEIGANAGYDALQARGIIS